jgi:hypothetical protein
MRYFFSSDKIHLLYRVPQTYFKTSKFITESTNIEAGLLLNFCNKIIFYDEELLAPRQNPELEDQVKADEMGRVCSTNGGS